MHWKSLLGSGVIVLPLAMSLLQTLWMVRDSRMNGRLSAPSTYDDCVYLRSGLELLQTFYSNGFSGVTSSYMGSPPHSPFTSFSAAIGFAFFGVQDWAPYMVNFSVLFLFLASCNYLQRSVPNTVRILSLLFLCSLPLSGRAITTLRPDFPAALFVCLGGLFAFMTRSSIAPGLRRFYTGLCFAVAFLAKPSMSPLTLSIFSACIFIPLFLDHFLESRRSGWLALFAEAGLPALVVLIIVLPHYILDRRHIYEYILDNVYGSASNIFAYQAPLSGQFLYYLVGPGGAIMFGRHLALLALLIAIGIIGIFLEKGKPPPSGLLGLTCLTFLSYLIASLLGHKNPFFGLTFQILTVFIAISCLAHLFSPTSTFIRTRRILRATGILVLIVGVLLGFPIDPTKGSTIEAVTIPAESSTIWNIHNWVIQTTAGLNPRGACAKCPHRTVFLTTSGVINACSLNWTAIKQKLELDFYDLHREDDLIRYREYFSFSDFVVATEPNAFGVFEWLPSARVAGETLEILRRDSAFSLISEFEVPGQKKYFIFRRLASATRPLNQ